MKKPQVVKCDYCGALIEREQGEDRECVHCEIQRHDGEAINNEH